jgi:hypothetical protein
MSYKHWTSDESSWNKNPIPVFNEVPSLVALQPRGLAGKLRTVVSGWEEMLIAPVVVVPVIKKLRECVAHPQFTDLELMCHVDQECPRCGVFRGFVETPRYDPSTLFQQQDVMAWAARFSAMLDDEANILGLMSTATLLQVILVSYRS